MTALWVRLYQSKMIALLSDPSSWIRYSTVTLLARIDYPPQIVVPSLFPLLRDKNVHVVESSINALGLTVARGKASLPPKEVEKVVEGLLPLAKDFFHSKATSEALDRINEPVSASTLKGWHALSSVALAEVSTSARNGPWPLEATIPGGKLIREEIISPDGAALRLSAMYVNRGAIVNVRVARQFEDVGVELSGLLINQDTTKRLWGIDPGTQFNVGRRIQQYVSESEISVSACYGLGHFGWQSGAFLISDRKLRLLKNDQNQLTGSFCCLTLQRNQHWTVSNVTLEQGHPDSASKDVIASSVFGFNAPLILRDGKAVPLDTLVPDRRFLADPRNVFDFGVGKGPSLPNDEFWKPLRQVLPLLDVLSMQALARGERVSIRGDAQLTAEQIDSFNKVAASATTENGDVLSNYITLTALAAEGVEFSVHRALPQTRLPAIGYGVTQSRELLIILVDGRQKNSAGCTVSELAELLCERGAHWGFFGCSGGDVALVAKHDAKMHLLTSPQIQTVTLVKSQEFSCSAEARHNNG